MGGFIMHMIVSVIVWVVPLALSKAFDHDSCFNDSGNLAAPTDEYALISVVSEITRLGEVMVGNTTMRQAAWRFRRIDVSGIPSANLLYSVQLQGKQSLWTIQACPLNGYYEKYMNRTDVNMRLGSNGLTACTSPLFDKANCTLYRFRNPETSKCEETEFSIIIRDGFFEFIRIMFELPDHKCYAGRDRTYFFATCIDKVGNIKEKILTFADIHGKESKPTSELLAHAGPTSELYYLALWYKRETRLIKIVVTLLGNELQIGLERQTVDEPTELYDYNANIFEGPSNTSKLMIAKFTENYTIYRMMAPDMTLDYRIKDWPPLNMDVMEFGMRRPAKLVPICRKSTPTARQDTIKTKVWPSLLLIVFVVIVLVIICVVIGLPIRAARRRRSNVNKLGNSKIAMEQNALVCNTWVFKLKEMLGLTRPSCLVVKGIKKEMETNQRRLGEPISDGSTINM